MDRPRILGRDQGIEDRAERYGGAQDHHALGPLHEPDVGELGADRLAAGAALLKVSGVAVDAVAVCRGAGGVEPLGVRLRAIKAPLLEKDFSGRAKPVGPAGSHNFTRRRQ